MYSTPPSITVMEHASTRTLPPLPLHGQPSACSLLSIRALHIPRLHYTSTLPSPPPSPPPPRPSRTPLQARLNVDLDLYLRNEHGFNPLSLSPPPPPPHTPLPPPPPPQLFRHTYDTQPVGTPTSSVRPTTMLPSQQPPRVRCILRLHQLSPTSAASKSNSPR
ncbi:hypothetical protein DFP73DRAFT_595696 [Morchella snyderi]|nr:hypothetical protein DFP73DRAFT_595696 [Morchella snyderi]